MHSQSDPGEMNPPLLKLHLHNCSMLVKVTEELLKSLSTCKNLTHLDLGRNTLKTAGHHLVTVIRSLGDSSQLQELKLIRNCKIPMDVCSSHVTSVCLHAKGSLSLISPKISWVKLDIILQQSIRCWGNDPPLQKAVPDRYICTDGHMERYSPVSCIRVSD